MHAVVKDTPAVVLTCMEKFFSISSHTPQVRCVLWKERSFAACLRRILLQLLEGEDILYVQLLATHT